MQRVTVTLDDELMDNLDRLMAEKGYANRSEALRDLARAGLKQVLVEAGSAGPSIGVLSYVYDHSARDLAKRLTETFHAHHDLTLSSLHVHIDHDTCLEVALLKGDAERVAELAQTIVAERAVRHGQLSLIPMSAAQLAHEHAHRIGEGHPHDH